MKDNKSQIDLRRHKAAFAVIMAVAVLLRLIWLKQLSGSELSGELSIDSEFYRDLALGIINGRGIPGGALTFNPLYPIFLTVIFKLFGDSLFAARLIQSILGLLTLILIYLTGKRVSIRNGAPSGYLLPLTAMAMAALYPQFLLYEGMLLGTVLEILLLIFSFYLCLLVDDGIRDGGNPVIRSKEIPLWLVSIFLGASCGAGALGRPNLFLLLVVSIPVWMILRAKRFRTWIKPALGFLAGAAIFLLPPTAYNVINSGQFVPVTAHGGINFYIGNRPGTYGVYQPPEDMRGEMRGLIEDSRSKAESETGRKMSDAEASDYYMDKAINDIKRDPGGWLLLMGRKLILFWNKIEVHDMPEVLYFQDSIPLFKFPFLAFSIISPLGLAGLYVFLRKAKNRSVVCLFLGIAHISVLLFYLNSRYRLPIVPVIIVLAAYFISWAFHEISARRFKRVSIVSLGALLIFFLVSSRTIVSANKGNVYTYLGTYYMNSGNESKAAQAFEKAYEADPGRDTSMINYGRILMINGRYAEAARVFSRAYSLNPRYPGLAILYAYTLQQIGRNEEAGRLAKVVYSSGEPEEKVTACKILATNAFFLKRMDEVERWVRAGLEIAPDDPELRMMLRSLDESL